MTASVLQEYYHPGSLDSGAMGGFQSLDNGNVMLAWGYNPSFIEYDTDGIVVMDVQRGKIQQGFQADMFAYRVHKGGWKGRPYWPPSAAVDAPYGTTENATIHLSWNGATDIASWAIVSVSFPSDNHH